MKKTLLFLALAAAPTLAATKTVSSLPEAKAKQDLSLISEVRGLERMNPENQSSAIVNLVTLNIDGANGGMAPTQEHYLTFRRSAESSVSRSVFLIGNSWGLKSVRMVSRGNYRVELQQIDMSTGTQSVQKLSIDINKFLRDESSAEFGEFEDKYIESSIQISE